MYAISLFLLNNDFRFPEDILQDVYWYNSFRPLQRTRSSSRLVVNICKNRERQNEIRVQARRLFYLPIVMEELLQEEDPDESLPSEKSERICHGYVYSSPDGKDN